MQVVISQQLTTTVTDFLAEARHLYKSHSVQEIKFLHESFFSIFIFKFFTCHKKCHLSLKMKLKVSNIFI